MSAPALSRVVAFDADAHFSRRMAATPLLSHDEERDLAENISAGLAAQARLDSEHIPETDRVALRAASAAGRRARTRFIEANLRLVAKMARRYHGRGLPLADLIQEGTIGLTRAVDKFDPSHGVHFGTYAEWWIRQALVAGVNTARVVRRPAEVEDALRKMHAVRIDLHTTSGQEPTVEAIAAQAGMTPTEVLRLRALDRSEVSLDVQVGVDAGATIGDLLPDSAAEQAFRTAEATSDGVVLSVLLSAVLAELPVNEAEVLRLRFGLGGGAPLDLDATATRLGVGRLDIRRLEGAALSRLRDPNALAALREHL